MDGEEGGYGRVYLRAWAVASMSCPAKTVTNFSGFLSPCNDIRTPGRAVPAAQPQTELSTKSIVPLLLGIVWSTCSGVFNSSNPAAVNSSRIGAHIYSG